tara:strand:+ start:2260 stop:3441 length:1182 start_codon:yes stop_codon:yes gene_type:complete
MENDKISYKEVNIITVAKVGTQTFMFSEYTGVPKKHVKGHHGLTCYHPDYTNLKDTLEHKTDNLIIVGIRNPIERNLSFLMSTWMTEFSKNEFGKFNTCCVPDSKTKENVSATEIIQEYWKKGDKYHFAFNMWFTVFLSLTKITEFDKDKGVSFYKFKGNNTIMIYQLEKLKQNSEYIKKKIGLKDIIHFGDQKKTQPQKYEEIKNKICYPKEYLNRLLNTDIMKLFYNPEDIQRFYSSVKTWSPSKSVPPYGYKYLDLKIVCVSGYFDPIHIGHIEYMKKSKQIGNILMVIVNNDHQATLKKGKPFMPAKERVEIIKELGFVDIVIESIDKDRTVCETLATVEPKPDYFCNGGDQSNNTIPEGPVCEKRGIELRDGFGDKIQSSSWLIKGSK